MYAPSRLPRHTTKHLDEAMKFMDSVLQPKNCNLLPYCNSYISESMCGGFMARGTDFCSHIIRTRQNIARCKNFSFGVLFIDIVGAFASVVRSLIISTEMPDEYVVYIFKTLKLDEQCFDEFKQILRSTSAFHDAGVPAESKPSRQLPETTKSSAFSLLKVEWHAHLVAE